MSDEHTGSRRAEGSGQAADAEAAHAVRLPGTPKENADTVQSISPEGRPADSGLGPWGLWGLVIVVGGVLLLGAVLLGVFVHWGLGIGTLLLGGLFMLMNPVIGAASQRAHDREEAGRRERA